VLFKSSLLTCVHVNVYLQKWPTSPQKSPIAHLGEEWWRVCKCVCMSDVLLYVYLYLQKTSDLKNRWDKQEPCITAKEPHYAPWCGVWHDPFTWGKSFFHTRDIVGLLIHVKRPPTDKCIETYAFIASLLPGAPFCNSCVAVCCSVAVQRPRGVLSCNSPVAVSRCVCFFCIFMYGYELIHVWCVCMFFGMWLCVCKFVFVIVYMCVCVCICMWVCLCVWVSLCGFVCGVSMSVFVWVNVYVSTFGVNWCVFVYFLCGLVRVCDCVCVCVVCVSRSLFDFFYFSLSLSLVFFVFHIHKQSIVRAVSLFMCGSFLHCPFSLSLSLSVPSK